MFCRIEATYTNFVDVSDVYCDADATTEVGVLTGSPSRAEPRFPPLLPLIGGCGLGSLQGAAGVLTLPLNELTVAKDDN